MNPLDYVRKTPYELYIDGKYVPAEKGKVVDVINPAKNEPFAQVYRGTVEDAEKAVQAARKAFDEGPWGRTAARDRAKILAKAAQITDNGTPGRGICSTRVARMRLSLRVRTLLLRANGSGFLQSVRRKGKGY